MAFGPKVVGKEKYTKTVASKRGKAGFGPRVLGKSDKAKKVEEPKRTERGTVQTPVKQLVSASAPAVEDSLSIEQVREILSTNPAFIETLHVQELERAEGPRREALLAIRETATTQGLDDIVSEIDELMTETGMAAPTPVPTPAPDAKTLALPKDFTELKALAKTFDVDLAKNRSKVDITAAIVQAATARGLTVTTEE